MYTDLFGHHWYKGNLHTHTNLSDGKYSPEATIEAYRAEGYDFIALTDHWKYSKNDERDGFVILSGTEYNFNGEDVLTGVFHIVGVGMTSNPLETIGRGSTVQETIDTVIACGGLPILAHPSWSMNTYEQVAGLKNVCATEIYNSVSGAPRNCRPYSGEIVDQSAARGLVWKLIADDDTHFWGGEQCLSYIWVDLADKPLNHDNLMEALREGRYYATQKPRFSAAVENNEYVVRTEADDNVCRVTVFTNRPWENCRSVVGERLTEARFPLNEKQTFIRAEIYTADGKIGWSQIIKLK